MSTDLIREKQKRSITKHLRTPRVSALRKREFRVKPEFEFREPQPAEITTIEEPAKRPRRRRRRKRRRYSAGRGSRRTFLNID